MTSGAGSGLVLLAVLATAGLLAAPAIAQDAAPAAPKGTLLVAPDVQKHLPPISPRVAVQIADRTPQVRAERGRHPGLHPDNITLFKGSGNWDISYLSGTNQLADVAID